MENQETNATTKRTVFYFTNTSTDVMGDQLEKTPHTDGMFDEIVDLIDKEQSTHNVVDTLVVMLNECSEPCKKSVTISKRRQPSWLDIECRVAKKEKYRKLRKYRNIRTENNIR